MPHKLITACLRADLLRNFKPNVHDLQFWGYETGDLLAAIAGEGGLHAFCFSLRGDIAVGGLQPSKYPKQRVLLHHQYRGSE